MVYVPGFSIPQLIRVHMLDALGAVVCREPMLPPMSMRRVIGIDDFDYRGGKFLKQGRDFMAQMQQQLEFSADAHFFDLGSGCGQYAIPLTAVLSAKGSYIGLEIGRSMVRWCQKHISSAHPNFNFIHCDVHNAVYNRFGKVQPQDYRFPLADSSFDIVFSSSVFTHLPPEAAANYLAECGRILKPGGRFFGTFFLIENGTRSPDGALHFQYPVQDVALSHDPKKTEWAIAYRTDWVLEQASRGGLKLLPPVHHGSWAGKRPERDHYQDSIFLQKQ